MIYTRIEWIWTDEGLEETFVESCEYEGEFMMCGGGDNGSEGDDEDGDDSSMGGESSTAQIESMLHTSGYEGTPEFEARQHDEDSIRFETRVEVLNAYNNMRTGGTSGEGTGSATTTTATAETTGDDETLATDDSSDEPLSTFVDDEALRKTRRRLRDRFGRRATRGGGAETVGTGYSLGG